MTDMEKNTMLWLKIGGMIAGVLLIGATVAYTIDNNSKQGDKELQKQISEIKIQQVQQFADLKLLIKDVANDVKHINKKLDTDGN